MNCVRRFFGAWKELPDAVADAYADWYRHKYIPSTGDLISNTRDLYIIHDHRWAPVYGYVVMYHAPHSIKIPAGTPMVCLGHLSLQFGKYFIVRLLDYDVSIPERTVIYIKTESRM